MVQRAETSHDRESGIQSVRRAAALLRAIGNGAGELGVSELGRKLNLHKSTVSRLLATLEREGLLERPPGSEKYRLGYELLRLAGQAGEDRDLLADARPFLVELAERTRETANLAVLDGEMVHNVAQVSGPHLVRIGNWVGRRTPPHCVANGKALLAFQPEPDLRRLLAQTLERFTPRTVTSRPALRAELARVRQQGFALAEGEIEDGLNAVAAPVRDGAGRVVAALSVSGPAYRLTRERLPELGAVTKDVSDRLSERLGRYRRAA